MAWRLLQQIVGSKKGTAIKLPPFVCLFDCKGHTAIWDGLCAQPITGLVAKAEQLGSSGTRFGCWLHMGLQRMGLRHMGWQRMGWQRMGWQRMGWQRMG